MDPAGGAVGSALRSMMNTPGNWISSNGPFFTTVPPIAETQNSFWASTSFTARCMWPMLTPAAFGGASCARTGATERIATPSVESDRIVGPNISAFMKELKDDVGRGCTAVICGAVLADQAADGVDRRGARAVPGRFTVGSDVRSAGQGTSGK